MAFTVANVDNVGYRRTWSVIASADGDTTKTIAHGITCPGATTGAQDAYALAKIVPILSPCLAPAALSQWYATVDRTNITIGKTTATGSGDAGIQLYVSAWHVHSFIE